MTRENFLRGIALQLRDRQQQMLGGDVFVFEIGSFFEGAFQELVGRRRDARLRRSAGDLRQLLDRLVRFVQNGLRANADLFKNRRDDAFFVFG